MKKIFFAYLLPLSILFILSSCQKAGEESTMGPSEKAIVYKAMEAFDSGDADALDSLCSPDYIEHQIDTVHMKARGLEAVKEIFHEFHKAVADQKTTIHAVGIAGDTVMVYNTTNGILMDTLMGMPPTNKPVSFTGVDMFLVKNGKIAEHWGFADINAIQQMMMPAQNMSNEKMKGKKK